MIEMQSPLHPRGIAVTQMPIPINLQDCQNHDQESGHRLILKYIHKVLIKIMENFFLKLNEIDDIGKKDGEWLAYRRVTMIE